MVLQKIEKKRMFTKSRIIMIGQAVWRTFGFDIHHRWPAVQRLSFHLPKKQPIFFKDDDNLHELLQNNESM